MRKMGNWKQTSPPLAANITASLAFLFASRSPFHHGRELEMDDVIASLKRIKRCRSIRILLTLCRRRPGRWNPSHATGPLVTVIAGASSGDILPREWETLSNFASHPIGTGRMR